MEYRFHPGLFMFNFVGKYFNSVLLFYVTDHSTRKLYTEDAEICIYSFAG